MNDEKILLGHGGGGGLTRELIRVEVMTRFGNPFLRDLPDGATLPFNHGGRLVVSTDSFVVHPICFPGGNIGDLAVYGTVNDVAVAGGCARWLALSMILEEGLPLVTLRTVLDSMTRAAERCGVDVVTGDTKVVPRGKCDGLYVTTTGMGEALNGFRLGTDRIRVGDRVLVSGPLGDHAMAVVSAREGFRIASGPVSDTAPVNRLVEAVERFGEGVRFMRDPTRGGVAAVLNEIVEERPIQVELKEQKIPFSPGAVSVAELLGMELLHAASEGRVILICAPEVSTEIVAAWRALPEGERASEIGVVTDGAGRVVMETAIGGRRLIDLPQGELLPRIC